MKRVIAFICVLLIITGTARPTYGEELEGITSGAYILMEASTGKIICEMNCDEKRAPASVTKVMTLLLIFEALRNEKIHKEDMVTVSEYAASMGGSQVFLEPFETQSVDTLIKCIAVASANDACVAMAEKLCGSEAAFVTAMNEKAKELGMLNTHFVNCCGLDDSEHITSPRDIAIMSRELICNYPEVFDYCQIWMDSFTHVTKRGSSEFTLSNTNKLLKQYPYATGLKTGSTSKAGCCLSATATKDGVTLIAVIMGAPNSKTRFSDAKALLDYGFGIISEYSEDNNSILKAEVKEGVRPELNASLKEQFHYIFTENYNADLIEKRFEWQQLKAPVKKGEVVGKCIYLYDNTEIGEVDIVAMEEVKRITYKYYLELVITKWYKVLK